ncbi:thioredoxin family protein [uncultured Bacteroides sp.]|uniref:thioredoxin family protein n=1 Tax=uncultured Bacteroides sp. TaxID=162156 RepID=UPI002AAB03E3|nr:thioredoxin family protein [uncultured Bacteroides sp.]
MNEKKTIFRLKMWHFSFLLLFFFFLTCWLSEREIETIPAVERKLNAPILQDSISNERLSFVFFYKDDSDICKKVRHNFYLLSAQKANKANFIELNADEYPEYCAKWNISGVPNIVVLRDNEECCRIMGLVSLKNMLLICDRYL